MRATVVGLVMAAALFAGACGGGGGESDVGPGGGGVAPGEGALLIAHLGQIIERDLDGGAETVLLTLPEPNAFVLDPAVSPDGTRVAFVKQPPAKIVDGRFDAGSDLWVMSRSGLEARPVFEHVQANQLVRFPRWEDDENVLAIVQEIDTQPDLTRVIYTLERINVQTGAREHLVEDVLAFDVSPDGERLVYAKLLPERGEVLQTSDLEGGGAIEVVGLDQMLAPFGFPRYSPDGSLLAFASADQTGAQAEVELVTAGRVGGAWVARERALADGLPQDIWTVEVGGGRAVRVADLKEDLPALTWDGSGERIYVMGVNGLYEVDITSGAVERLAEGRYHAQIEWAPPRPAP